MKPLIRTAIVASALLVLFLAACATAPPTRPEAEAEAAEPERPTERVYEGAGRDASMLEAMNLSKMDAVRKAVIDMIGVGNEQANRDALDEVLYGTTNPNAYILKDTYETLRKERVGEDYLIEARMAVNLQAVESTLKAHGLFGGERVTEEEKTAGEASTPSAGEAVASAEATEGAAEALEDAAGSQEELTAEEKRIIARYVDGMTYMVYFNEEASEDPFYMKTAVGIANEYLTSNAMEAVDFAQVERLKTDQQMAYEEETGESISMIQWIAQKLNADVYIEIDGRTSGESSSGKYYGQASVTLKGFEASTGRLLGSQPWNSPKTFSTSSEEAARINALQTSVYKAMPIVIEQAKAYMAKALRDGIKYELILQNTLDPRAISDFRRKLQRKVRDIRTVNQTAEETKFSVYVIGSVEDLVDLVYDVAETIPGLEGMYQVLLRGKSVTFNTGL
ncbi:MAG: hypothetical protein JW820_05725 [Spirochaetales bacterium]|nr:hypothetical protein [Spirochaetales bacterium]